MFFRRASIFNLDRHPVLPGPFVIDNAFDDTAPIDRLYQWFLSSPNTGDFGGFFDKKLKLQHQNVLNWTGGDPNRDSSELLYFARFIVRRISQFAVTESILNADGRSVCGYEFWGNVSNASCKTDCHIDRDENLSWTRCMIDRLFPVISSVVYIGPRQQLDGGDLLIDMGDDAVSFHVQAMRKSLAEQDYILARSQYLSRISFKYNRVVFFPGDRPHLVTPLKELDAHRCSIGVGFWHRIIN